MAKKKSAKTGDARVKKPRGMPQKECPECHTMQHARKAVCEKCGFTFPQKVRTKKRKAKSPDSEQRMMERAARNSERQRLAMEFVLFSQQGDIGKALEAVQGFEHSSLADFIEKAGGKERAVSVLAALKQKQGS